MSKKFLIGIAVALLAFIASAYYGYRMLIEAGYPSCVLSIEETIGRELGRGAVKGAIVTDEWQTLDEDQEQSLFTAFRLKGMTFDCKQFPQFADGSALIGSKGHIRFRKEDTLVSVRIDSDENHERSY